MAYLTKYSFSQLCKTTEIEIKTKDDFYTLFMEYVLDDYRVYKIFNSLDVKNIIQQVVLLNSELFKDEKTIKIFKKEFSEVPERKDNLRYVFKIEGKVKYHLYKDCEFLDRGFRNFNTPDEFFELEPPDDYRMEDGNRKQIYRNEAIEELREWFIKNDFTLKRLEEGKIHTENIIMRYNAYFPKKYKGIKELNLKYKLLEKRDGNALKDSIGGILQRNIDLVKDKLYTLVEQRQNLCNLIILDKIISKHDYLYDKTEVEIKEKLNKLKIEDRIFKNHYTIQNLKDFKQIIENYIKVKYRFDEDIFSPEFLEKYNLECCKSCNDRKINEQLNRII